MQIQRLDKSLSLPAIVVLESQLEQGGLDTGEPSAQILGRRKGKPEDEVGIVILLAFEDDALVLGARER